MPQTTDSQSTTSDEAAEHEQTLPALSGNGEADASVDSVVPVTALLEQAGTIPFVGLTPTTDSDYPNPVSPVVDRFAPGEPLSFKEAIHNAGRNRLPV